MPDVVVSCKVCKGIWFTKLTRILKEGAAEKVVEADSTGIWRCNSCGDIVDFIGVYHDPRKSRTVIA